MKKLNIAFLTPQYSSEIYYSGLGIYIKRMARSLANMGHKIEIFTIGNESKVLVDSFGIRENYVKPCLIFSLRRINRFLSRFSIDFKPTIGYIEKAFALMKAFKKREVEVPFDIVQSSSYGLAGLFLGRKSNRTHLVRISSDCILWRKTDGLRINLDLRLRGVLERFCVRKANIAYAPSHWLADHFSRSYNINVNVLRPPFTMEKEMGVIGSDHFVQIPDRFLIHFGVIGLRKGSDFVAEALSLVWCKQPDFKMIWAGWESRPGDLKNCTDRFGEKKENIIFMERLKKPDLYALVKRAEASVLPSRVDNLPNTAIESLALGTPIIAFHGASLEELIEPGKSGEAVPFGDIKALANAMLKVWRHEVPWIKPQFQIPKLFNEMEPVKSARNFLQLSGFKS